ncbi:hypothetical protein [Halopelagius fulvigenes]|uniref:Uncharacterized protein n=1 Tax=Halopelagius fulvigenes TaxID=1198324 RepID=A0ABD5U183_9EURY
MVNQDNAARLPYTATTHDEALKPLKRAGKTYDELLRRMASQYDPEAAHDPPPVVNQ